MMIVKNDISQAYDRIRPYVRTTPTIEIEADAFCNVPVSLKLEHLQFTGSFKVRGALNTVLSKNVPEAGVVAVSGGNHGAAVGFAASRLGHKAKIFAPDYAGDVKMARMRQFGAEVAPSGTDFAVVVDKYEAYAKETGALAVHPFDMPEVMAGQGTVGLELSQQVPDLDTVFVAVGGGGLIGGISSWYGDDVNVIAVESEETATYSNALKHGLDKGIKPSGITANSLGAPNLGRLPFDALKQHNRLSLVVSDVQIKEAQRILWDKMRVIAEPGGVTALAALTTGVYQPQKGERIGVVICGGNAEIDWFL
ncbi:threonine/serine dehydratase [Amylibacter sp. SFDW26]|uniref:threonine/serine dehydratase n=1 Tax=Amylibacter sp. SFDW26 TaxID=2652722 RepID=UPI00126145A2|nr:threonine/serine dehydratase [Amylibacter sp. SFDW26]KAB7615269.1 threonine/serine dehydratase [Amylibacter sp. SFDW26]